MVVLGAQALGVLDLAGQVHHAGVEVPGVAPTADLGRPFADGPVISVSLACGPVMSPPARSSMPASSNIRVNSSSSSPAWGSVGL